MPLLTYTGKAHRLQVGDVILDKGVPTQVEEEVATLLADREDVELTEEEESYGTGTL
jgi:hypothetical protein